MLKLVPVEGGFDLAFDDPALASDDDAVATLIYALLLTDAEAPLDREPDRYLRRGWWADPQAGSGLWHIRRQPLGSAARREAIATVAAALSRREPALTEVQVTELPDSSGNVSRVSLKITGKHNGRQFLIKAPL